MKLKKILIMFLALLLCVTALPLRILTTVEGATVQGNDTVLQGKRIDTFYGSALKGSDGSVYYEGTITAVNFSPGGTYTTKKTSRYQCKEMIGIDSSGNQSWLYCVEKNSGFSKEGYSSTNIGNSSYLRMDARTGTLAAGLNKLAKEKGISGLDGVQAIQYILTATIYGWQPDATMPAELSAQGLNDWDWFFGTQVVIWEFQQGIRQTPTQCNGNGFNNGDAIYSWLKGRPAEYAYNYVLKMMAQHRVVPSFSARNYADTPTYNLKWSNNNKRYETTLTDTAGYAFNLQFEDSDIKCVKSGNKYTIYTTKTITSPILSITQKEMHISANQELLVWGKSGKQTMVTGMQDPVMFYMKLQTDKPTITINKTGTTADDINNRIFYVYKDNASTACLALTTDSRGYVSGSLPGNGTYRVVEQNASKYNVTYSIQTFTYPGSAFDANNNITINVDNALKVGYLQLKKESEDGIVQGLQFRIEGNGTSVTGTTNSNGYLVVNGSTNIALMPGTYTVTEFNVPERYEYPDPITVNITKGETIIRTVTNTLEPTFLTIKKMADDHLVAGIQFRIVGTTTTGKSVDRVVITGQGGSVTVDMEQGTYIVSEINVPSKYYTPSSQRVTLNDGNGATLYFTNQLKPGYLQILKTSEDGIVSGFKFRVQGAEQIMFPEKAYMVGQVVVVDSSASVGEVFGELGLDSSQYYVLNNNTGEQATLGDNISAGFVYHYGAPMGSGYCDSGSIYNQDGTLYATMVIRGHYLNSPYSSVGTCVGYMDISGAESCLGATANNPMYIAFDVDRDGVITQADVDAMTVAYSNGTCVTAIVAPTIDATGYTNSAGYVEFGERAYFVNVAEGRISDCTKYAVAVDRNATVEQLLLDLGLNPEQHYISVDNYRSSSDDNVYTSNKLSNTSIVANMNSGTTDNPTTLIHIYNTDASTPIAQVIFLGCMHYGANRTVEASDLTKVQELIGQTVADKTYPESLYLATFDVDRDGIITQNDFDIITAAYNNGTCVTNTNKLLVPAGTYTITELEVPDRYVPGFEQTITVAGEETKVVNVNNVLNRGGIIIVKTAEDGVIAGVQFQITHKTTGKTYIVTTDENGRAIQNLEQAGDYSIVELNTPNRYEEGYFWSAMFFDTPKKYITIRAENILKLGTLQLLKESEDHVVSDVSFRIQSVVTTNGSIIDQTVTTNTDGNITLDLPQGTYVVTELNVADRYVEQMSQMVVLTAGETASMTFTNTLKVPTLKIAKTSEDEIVEGVQFRVTGTTLAGAEYSEVFTTDANGLISAEIPQGTYTVTEIQDNRYIALDSQTITLTNDETISIAFHNVLKSNWVVISKKSEDGAIAGIPFLITGMGEDGVEVNMNVTTGSNGDIEIILKPGTYTITELDVDEKFIIPEQQEVTIAYDQSTQIVTFQNILKKFQVTLTKKDGSTEFGLPQGDGTMAGAVYGLYQEDGTLIAEYTTDKNGRFTTEAIPCEATYIQEITAPKGYLLDETQYWLESSLEDCYLAVTSLTLEVTDYPVTGSISILKKKGTEEKWEYEAGAEFEVYLKSAGSYEAANEWERDFLVTDEATGANDNNLGEATTGGEAGTKDLPMGTYIVHQVSGSDGFHLVADMEVTLTEDNPTVHLEMLNLCEAEMPDTGGNGTMPFVVSGIICMLIACSFAIMKKRNCENK